MTNFLTFISLVAIWSTTPLAMKWSSTGAPFSSLAIRMILGAVCCIIWLLLTNKKLTMSRAEITLYVVAGLSICSMALVYVAAQTLPSGWISVLFGLSPIITGVLSLLDKNETFTWPEALALVFGLCGLALIFSGSSTFTDQAYHAILLVLTAVCMASVGAVLIRLISKGRGIAGIQITTGGLIVAIPIFVALAFYFENPTKVQFTHFAIANIVYLGVVGSCIGFTLYYFLLKRMTASQVALTTLVTPVISLLLGSILNNEPVIARIWFGTGVIFIGLICHQYAHHLKSKKE